MIYQQATNWDKKPKNQLITRNSPIKTSNFYNSSKI
jgi:hypothetical protein